MRRCTLPLPGVDAEAPVGRSSRRLLLLLTAVVVAAVTAGTVLAYFTATVAAGSNGAAKAAGVNQGATPTATVSTSVGREVTVSWGASTLTNGHAVDGYAVQRYPAAGGLPTTGPYGTCSVTVTGTSCVEDLVPPGQWRYTVTPVFATNWRGAESAQSGIVTLTQAIAVSGSPYGAAKFTPTASGAPGSIAGFGPNEGVSYRLDSSTSLAGSPSSVAANGNASITALAIPNAGDGAHTVWALGNAASPSQASTAIVIDTTPPTVNATLSPAPNGAGWNNTSPVQVTLAANDGSGSGINQIKYTTDGSDPTTSGTALVYSAPFNRSSTTTVKFFATDNAGNASAVQTQAVNIDTVPPTNSVSANVQSGNVLLAGTTLWYRGVNAGSFTLSNALTDSGGSGTASTSYAALAGSSGGWTFTPSSVTSGPPYVSNTFSWSGGTSSAPTETVTGYDVASNFASTTLNLTNDSNGPAGGSVDATGLVGTGGRYSNSTSLSIAFSAGTDAGVGIASSGFQLLRASAPLSSGNGTSDGSCGSYGSYTQVGSNDPVSPVADTVSDHTCYRYEYVVADKLGNSTTYTSPDIKIDTTGPSAPAVTLSSASGNTYISGSTVYTNPQAGKSGGFTVGATTSDSDSGIQKVNFPALTGYSAGGGDVTSSPYSTTYSWSGSGATASGSKTVTAYDNAALTATGSFTVTPDTTNPTISASAKKADNTTYTAGTWTNQTVTVHYTCSDAGSGIASCPADQVYSADGTQTASGTATDNVGNSGSATFGLVEIDKTNPTISASAKNADNSTYTAGTWTNQTVTVHYTCSDALSGIASCPADQVFSAEGTTASTSGTATDNAGNSASASFGPIKIDKTVPANSISLLSQSTQAGPAGTTNAMSYLTGSTVYFDGGAAGSFQIRNAVSDALSGPASSAFGALGGTTGGWTFTSSTVTTPSGGPYVSNAFNWAASAAGSPTETVTGADAAGNTTATVLTFTNDQTAPTTPVVSFPAASGNYTNSSWNASGGGCATSTICGTASDTGSGIGKVQVSVQATSGTSSGKYWNGSDFSSATEVLLNAAGTTSWSLAFPAANFTDANYTVNVYAIDNVGNFASKSASFLIDNVAPTSSVASITPSPNGAGWEKANTTVALQASDSVSGVATIFWSESGAQTASGSNAGGSSFNTPAITAEGTTTLTYHAVDNAGNVEANNTYVVKLDKTAPTNSLSLVNGSGGGSYLSGSTVYYRGSVAGQFQLQDAVADGLSGPASSAFAALGGTSTGWSFTSSTVSSPSGGPYVSNVFSWTGGTSSAPTEVATGSDVAGNTTAAGSLTFTNDSTAPSTTAALSPAANGSGWNNTSPVQVTLTPTDAGSGVSRTKYTTDGTDPSTSGTAVVYSAPFNVSSTTTVKYYSTDRVGNAESTRTQQVNIDTQPPNAPTMTSLPYAIKNGQSLSVTSASDNGASGIASVTYLFCSGTGCSPSTSIGSSSTGPGYAVTWNSQPADGTYTVAAKATDAAGNVSSLGATQQVTVENSVASTGIAISNHTGGTAGKPEAGDTITITYSGPLAVNTLCGNWSGDASSHSVTDASVTITDKGTQGTHDAILSTGVSSSTCGTVHFGTLDLSGANYVTSTVTFSGSTLSWNASSYTLTLTLGTPSNSAALGTDTTTRKPTYSADASITGSSGIAITTTTFTAPAYAVLF